MFSLYRGSIAHMGHGDIFAVFGTKCMTVKGNYRSHGLGPPKDSHKKGGSLQFGFFNAVASQLVGYLLLLSMQIS